MKISLRLKIKASNWMAGARRVSKKEPNAILINATIEKELRKIEAKLLEESLRGGPVDPVEILKKDFVREADFFTFAEDQIKLKNYSVETRRMYKFYLEKIAGLQKSVEIVRG